MEGRPDRRAALERHQLCARDVRQLGRHAAANDHLVSVSLPPGLPHGIYRVSWRSLSTIDVHPDAGDYPLFVGVAVFESSVTSAIYQSTATPATTFGRWWFYVAASLFGGS